MVVCGVGFFQDGYLEGCIYRNFFSLLSLLIALGLLYAEISPQIGRDIHGI